MNYVTRTYHASPCFPAARCCGSYFPRVGAKLGPVVTVADRGGKIEDGDPLTRLNKG